MSAHLDGKGLGDESDDNIYNGFYDNASGVGTMLEVARALVNSNVRPRRSIIFVATVGEEKGLLGADFFATGFATQEPGVDPEALYNHFMQTHYHGATDDQELRFDRESAARVATANFMIALEIANTEQRPRWHKDDFFGDLYGTELTRTE